MSYIIVKYVKHNDTELPVILLDGLGEVLNFGDDRDMAENYKTIFEVNSDSGHRYEVKHILDKL